MKYHFTTNVENELEKEDMTRIRTCDLLITRPTFYHRAMLDLFLKNNFFYNMFQKKSQKFANQQNNARYRHPYGLLGLTYHI